MLVVERGTAAGCAAGILEVIAAEDHARGTQTVARCIGFLSLTPIAVAVHAIFASLTFALALVPAMGAAPLGRLRPFTPSVATAMSLGTIVLGGILLLDDSRWSFAENLARLQAEGSPSGVAPVRVAMDLPMGDSRAPLYVLRASGERWQRPISADTNEAGRIALYADRAISMGVIAKGFHEDIKATTVAFVVKRELAPERTKTLGRFAIFESDPTGTVEVRFDALTRPLTPRRRPMGALGTTSSLNKDIADDVVLVVKRLSANAIEVDGQAIALTLASDVRLSLPNHIGAIRYDFKASDTLEQAMQTLAAMRRLYGARVYMPGQTYFTVEGVD